MSFIKTKGIFHGCVICVIVWKFCKLTESQKIRTQDDTVVFTYFPHSSEIKTVINNASGTGNVTNHDLTNIRVLDNDVIMDDGACLVNQGNVCK